MEEDLREVKFLLEYISSVLEKLALCDALENEDTTNNDTRPSKIIETQQVVAEPDQLSVR